MQLTNTGAIRIESHLARFTDDGKWMVSRLGTILGYVDSLAEVAPLIEKHRERVRARLAFVQRKAEERKQEALAHTSGLSIEMIRAHNITEVDDMPEDIRAATRS